MSPPSLGRLTRVELRAAWKNEATHFTPWLAEPDNLSLLAETLGLAPDGLELRGQEQAVGPFRADLLCRSTEDNSLVLIENQLERTDHGHLGQLLTYAAGLAALRAAVRQTARRGGAAATIVTCKPSLHVRPGVRP